MLGLYWKAGEWRPEKCAVDCKEFSDSARSVKDLIQICLLATIAEKEACVTMIAE